MTVHIVTLAMLRLRKNKDLNSRLINLNNDI